MDQNSVETMNQVFQQSFGYNKSITSESNALEKKDTSYFEVAKAVIVPVIQDRCLERLSYEKSEEIEVFIPES